MPCYCPSCAPNPKHSYTPEWRHACEVREVERMAAVDRDRYLAMVAKARGNPARTRILADMKIDRSEDLFG